MAPDEQRSLGVRSACRVVRRAFICAETGLMDCVDSVTLSTLLCADDGVSRDSCVKIEV